MDAGVHAIVLGIGGSATTDGGAGLLTGLGAVADRDQCLVDLTGLDPRLGDVSLQVACDVSNPLLGSTGAAAVYGPQKGATPEIVADLDGRLAPFADVLDAASGRNERLTAGRGRRGRGRLRPAVDPGPVGGLRPAAGRRARHGGDRLRPATRRRRPRASPARAGSMPRPGSARPRSGWPSERSAAGVPCIAIGGGVEVEGIDALAAVGAIAVPVSERPMTVEQAMAAGSAPIERCAERIARLMSL